MMNTCKCQPIAMYVKVFSRNIHPEYLNISQQGMTGITGRNHLFSPRPTP